MKTNRNVFRLEHIIYCIEKIDIITDDLEYGFYLKDWIKQDAIIRNFEVIGEAVSSIDENLKLMYPKVAWNEAKGMRNLLIHEYFNVDFDEVWKTLKEDLPILKKQIQLIIKDIKKEK